MYGFLKKIIFERIADSNFFWVGGGGVIVLFYLLCYMYVNYKAVSFKNSKTNTHPPPKKKYQKS